MRNVAMNQGRWVFKSKESSGKSWIEKHEGNW